MHLYLKVKDAVAEEKGQNALMQACIIDFTLPEERRMHVVALLSKYAEIGNIDFSFSQSLDKTDGRRNLTPWLSLLMDRPCHIGNECLPLRGGGRPGGKTPVT